MADKSKRIEDGIFQRYTKSGRKRYCVRVRDGYGRWFPARTFERLVDARTHKHRLLADRWSGKLAPSARVSHLSVEAYWLEWEQECRTKVSDGWKLSQDQMARDHIFPYVGGVRLTEFRPKQVGDLMGLVQRKGLAPQTCLHVFNMLHKMFDDAVHHFEYLDSNPVRRRYRPEVVRTERQYLTPVEARRLLVSSRDHYLGPAVWLALLSGLRTEAIQALRWESVDFANSQVLIREAYKRKVDRIEAYPKGKSWERVPIPPTLHGFLQERHLGRQAADFVAPGRHGDMLNYRVWLYGLKVLCRRVGVTVVTPHELRHSCTELYVDGGANLEDLRRLLNQKSSDCTLRYVHRVDSRLRAVANNVGNFLDPDITKPHLQIVP